MAVERQTFWRRSSSTPVSRRRPVVMTRTPISHSMLRHARVCQYLYLRIGLYQSATALMCVSTSVFTNVRLGDSSMRVCVRACVCVCLNRRHEKCNAAVPRRSFVCDGAACVTFSQPFEGEFSARRCGTLDDGEENASETVKNCAFAE